MSHGFVFVMLVCVSAMTENAGTYCLKPSQLLFSCCWMLLLVWSLTGFRKMANVIFNEWIFTGLCCVMACGKQVPKGEKIVTAMPGLSYFVFWLFFWKMQGLRLEGNKRISAWSASSSWQENEAFLVTSKAKVCPLEVLDRKVEMQSKVNGWVKLSVFLVLLWQEKKCLSLLLDSASHGMEVWCFWQLFSNSAKVKPLQHGVLLCCAASSVLPWQKIWCTNCYAVVQGMARFSVLLEVLLTALWNAQQGEVLRESEPSFFCCQMAAISVHDDRKIMISSAVLW